MASDTPVADTDDLGGCRRLGRPEPGYGASIERGMLRLDLPRLTAAESVIRPPGTKLLEARDQPQIIVPPNRDNWLSRFPRELGVLATQRLAGIEVPFRRLARNLVT